MTNTRWSTLGPRGPHLVMALLVSLGACAEGNDSASADGAAGDDVPAAVTPVFSAVQPEDFGAAGGQPNAWADFDRDGDLDLFVGFRGAPDRLYRNDGGRMTDVAAERGLADPGETRAAAWGDFDSDGDLDLYVGYPVEDDRPDRLYENRGPGEPFVDVAAEVGIDVRGTTRQTSWIDFDGDGDVDLSVALRDAPNRLYRNDGGRFTDVAAEVGVANAGRTVSTAWFDMDQDGDFDVFVANQNGDDDAFYRNDGGTFVDVAPELGMHQPGRPESAGSVGAAVADYDNDGDFDLFVASYGPDVLWQNQGDGTFVDVAAGTPLAADHHSVSAAWGDYDGDGWLDLYVTVFVSGEPEARDQIVRNVNGRFTDVTGSPFTERGASHGVAWADFDQDGDLDLALANNAPEVGSHPLYRNETNPERPGRSVQVVVLDADRRWLRPGAEVRVRDPATGRLLGNRLIDTGGGYSSQGAAPAHFAIPEGVGRVNIEATVLVGGTREVVSVDGVDPAERHGGWVVLRR